VGKKSGKVSLTTPPPPSGVFRHTLRYNRLLALERFLNKKITLRPKRLGSTDLVHDYAKNHKVKIFALQYKQVVEQLTKWSVEQISDTINNFLYNFFINNRTYVIKSVKHIFNKSCYCQHWRFQKCINIPILFAHSESYSVNGLRTRFINFLIPLLQPESKSVPSTHQHSDSARSFGIKFCSICSVSSFSSLDAIGTSS
jgi:hypothetical protein